MAADLTVTKRQWIAYSMRENEETYNSIAERLDVTTRTARSLVVKVVRKVYRASQVERDIEVLA